MRQTTFFERLMQKIGYVPKQDLIDEWDHQAELVRISEKKDDEINQLIADAVEFKRLAALARDAAVNTEQELRRHIANLERQTVVARSEADGDEYARDLFEQVFPGIPVPARLEEIMKALHNFMNSQAREIVDVRNKCLSFIELASHIKEILTHLREQGVIPNREMSYPLPGPEVRNITVAQDLANRFEHLAEHPRDYLDVGRGDFRTWATRLLESSQPTVI